MIVCILSACAESCDNKLKTKLIGIYLEFFLFRLIKCQTFNDYCDFIIIIISKCRPSPLCTPVYSVYEFSGKLLFQKYNISNAHFFLFSLFIAKFVMFSFHWNGFLKYWKIVIVRNRAVNMCIFRCSLYENIHACKHVSKLLVSVSLCLL